MGLLSQNLKNISGEDIMLEFQVHETCVHVHHSVPCLQPENLMLLGKDSSRLKIIDFGLSRTMDENCEVREMTGTPEFVGQLQKKSFKSSLYQVLLS